jgi:hypothetical protein
MKNTKSAATKNDRSSANSNSVVGELGMENGNGTRVVNLEVRKHFIRAMQEDVATAHIGEMLTATPKNSKWALELASDNGRDWYRTMGMYPTDVALFFTLTGPNSINADMEIDNVISNFVSVLKGIRGTQKWYLHSKDGEEWKALSPAEKMERARGRAEGTVTYAEVSMPNGEDVKEYTHGLVGIDAQIRMILRSMETSVDSDFKSRSHGLLLGPPGCGKSQTLSKFRDMFPNDAVLLIDGTAMTSAGITKMLDEELETMPRFIFVEEIDKAPNDAVAVLLGLMDKRGELRKTTYRKSISKDCRVCVFATANSFAKVRNMQEGALLSRFGNPIVYTRPSDDQMRTIINYNLEEMGIQHKNSSRWIDRALEWAKKWQDKLEIDTMDPRFLISMVVNGKDDLLSGKFQADLEATSLKVEDVAEYA